MEFLQLTQNVELKVIRPIHIDIDVSVCLFIVSVVVVRTFGSFSSAIVTEYRVFFRSTL